MFLAIGKVTLKVLHQPLTVKTQQQQKKKRGMRSIALAQFSAHCVYVSMLIMVRNELAPYMCKRIELATRSCLVREGALIRQCRLR
jgi:hypothetical protein